MHLAPRVERRVRRVGPAGDHAGVVDEDVDLADAGELRGERSTAARSDISAATTRASHPNASDLC